MPKGYSLSHDGKETYVPVGELKTYLSRITELVPVQDLSIELVFEESR